MLSEQNKTKRLEDCFNLPDMLGPDGDAGGAHSILVTIGNQELDITVPEGVDPQSFAYSNIVKVRNYSGSNNNIINGNTFHFPLCSSSHSTSFLIISPKVKQEDGSERVLLVPVLPNGDILSDAGIPIDGLLFDC